MYIKYIVATSEGTPSKMSEKWDQKKENDTIQQPFGCLAGIKLYPPGLYKANFTKFSSLASEVIRLFLVSVFRETNCAAWS